MTINIRNAIAEDADQLSAIAFAAKAHWGYSTEQMAVWLDRVTITRNAIELNATSCAETDDGVVGFCQIVRIPDAEMDSLEHLWVHPDHMRKGIGAELLRHVLSNSPRPLLIHAEPDSQAFYERHGARLIETACDPSLDDPHRTYPLMILER